MFLLVPVLMHRVGGPRPPPGRPPSPRPESRYEEEGGRQREGGAPQHLPAQHFEELPEELEAGGDR